MFFLFVAVMLYPRFVTVNSDSHRNDGEGRDGVHGRRRGRSQGGGPQEALPHAVRPQVMFPFQLECFSEYKNKPNFRVD